MNTKNRIFLLLTLMLFTFNNVSGKDSISILENTCSTQYNLYSDIKNISLDLYSSGLEFQGINSDGDNVDFVKNIDLNEDIEYNYDSSPQVYYTYQGKEIDKQLNRTTLSDYKIKKSGSGVILLMDNGTQLGREYSTIYNVLESDIKKNVAFIGIDYDNNNEKKTHIVLNGYEYGEPHYEILHLGFTEYETLHYNFIENEGMPGVKIGVKVYEGFGFRVESDGHIFYIDDEKRVFILFGSSLYNFDIGTCGKDFEIIIGEDINTINGSYDINKETNKNTQLRKNYIISKSLLKKTQKGIKYINQLEGIVKKLSLKKLKKIDSKLDTIDKKNSSYLKNKKLFDYLSDYIKLEIYLR